MAGETSMAKPQPRVTPDSAAFWEGCAQGQLRYQRCAACGHVQFPLRPFCTRCRAAEPVVERSAGLGTVHSYTVVFRAPTPAFKTDIPYTIALVDFDEGFRIMAHLRDCPPESAAIGLRVGVVFEPFADGGALPHVRPQE